MKQSLNYVTALPDFLEMQRVSFCWFIAQGLNEELSLFSRIHDLFLKHFIDLLIICLPGH